MKHFIVEATYLVPFETLKDVVPRHREWLQRGYDRGLFLCSGPQDPPVGGFLVARANSKEELDALFHDEPFRSGRLASFKFTEFQPVKRQPWTDEWFNGNVEATA